MLALRATPPADCHRALAAAREASVASTSAARAGVWGARAALPPVAGVRTDAMFEAPAFGLSTFRAIDSLPVFLGLPQRRARASLNPSVSIRWNELAFA